MKSRLITSVTRTVSMPTPALRPPRVPLERCRRQVCSVLIGLSLHLFSKTGKCSAGLLCPASIFFPAGLHSRSDPGKVASLVLGSSLPLSSVPAPSAFSEGRYAPGTPESWPGKRFPVSSTCALSGAKKRLPVVLQTGLLCPHAPTPILAFGLGLLAVSGTSIPLKASSLPNSLPEMGALSSALHSGG